MIIDLNPPPPPPGWAEKEGGPEQFGIAILFAVMFGFLAWRQGKK